MLPHDNPGGRCGNPSRPHTHPPGGGGRIESAPNKVKEVKVSKTPIVLYNIRFSYTRGVYSGISRSRWFHEFRQPLIAITDSFVRSVRNFHLNTGYGYALAAVARCGKGFLFNLHTVLYSFCNVCTISIPVPDNFVSFVKFSYQYRTAFYSSVKLPCRYPTVL